MDYRLYNCSPRSGYLTGFVLQTFEISKHIMLSVIWFLHVGVTRLPFLFLSFYVICGSCCEIYALGGSVNALVHL